MLPLSDIVFQFLVNLYNCSFSYSQPDMADFWLKIKIYATFNPALRTRVNYPGSSHY